jgi:formamidopyrimidine-DNA glycosylase
MPELPEVATTVLGLQKEIVGFRILDVWTDLKIKDRRKKDTIANSKYFPFLKKEVKNKKILSVGRRAKNVLINLSAGKTILIHMKMTGYLFFGENPKIKFAHVIFSLSGSRQGGVNKKFLVFSDLRKFGKITLLNTKKINESKHLKNLGPEPLDKKFTLKEFKKRLFLKPNGKIKSVLIDQEIIAGIGNIYSDEILWQAGINPERKVLKIKNPEFKKMFQAMKFLLKKGISLGGDSTSDYRNIYGLPGKFQLQHNAYQRTGEKCRKKGCKGVIIRKVINNRSAHFCSKHQIWL